MLVMRITSFVLLNMFVETIHSSRYENVAFKNKIIVLVKGSHEMLGGAEKEPHKSG